MEATKEVRTSPPESRAAAAGLGGVLVFCPETREKTRTYFRTSSRCPRTTTLVGFYEAQGYYRFIPVRCKCWTCPHCAPINARQLESKLAQGKPEKMLTLTCAPSPAETPKESHDRCRPKIAKMIAELRILYGKIEYAAILEEHQNGYPHWHLLLRSNFIPVEKIREIWLRLTGNSIVHITKIRHQKAMGRYAVKYMAKDLQKSKSSRLGRVISFSRNYLSPTRITPPQVKVEWMKWNAPVEEVLEKFAWTIKTISIDEFGEVTASSLVLEKPRSNDDVVREWANELPVRYDE